MCLVALSVLLASCKDDDAPYFERSGYLLDCFLDADEEYSLEDAVGRTLDASCSITNENEGVAELQVDQETGKHIIVPKKIGYTHINLVRGRKGFYYGWGKDSSYRLLENNRPNRKNRLRF